MARRAVAAVVEGAVKLGVEYRWRRFKPEGSGRQEFVLTSRANAFWQRIRFCLRGVAWQGVSGDSGAANLSFPAEVFFFGIPAGDMRFAPPALPTWLFSRGLFYGMPDIESRGLKIAYDGHGERVDPDTESRIVSPVMRKGSEHTWRDDSRP